MTPIDFTDVLLTPAVVARWSAIAQQAARDLRDVGITQQPGEEQLFTLDDGRLFITCNVQPGISVSMTAERGEWSRIENN